jgi:hypothetical protein
MTESVSKFEGDHARAIATLAEKLKIPQDEVVEIFRKEFDRLAVQARIPTFLVVLAMRNTRSILRAGHAHAARHEGPRP